MRWSDLIFWTGCGLVLTVGFVWGLMVVTTPEAGAGPAGTSWVIERVSGP